MEHKLRTMLEKVRAEVPGNIFTGVGVVVCNSMDSIPFLPMGQNSQLSNEVDTVSMIMEGSLATNVNHDGFNILGEDLNLLYRNVFISPPIENDIDLDIKQGFGARYVAAILASKIEGVAITAVVSNSYGIEVFKDGKIVGTDD